jgi:nucleoporin POM152
MQGRSSGDTGASATIILHGTPPFQVYYRSQRDGHSAREAVKAIYGSRGELKLQEEHSGVYQYSFVALSDANYKRVELDGPSITLTAHPLASVDFSHREQTGMRRQINSCSGSIVDIDIDLKGNGPWNVNVQVVDRTESKTMTFTGINTRRKSLQIPIPKRIDKEGGSFMVDLGMSHYHEFCSSLRFVSVSVEDASGCQRLISVPGVSINVRRIQVNTNLDHPIQTF